MGSLSMTASKTRRRFRRVRFNPVEMGVFLVVLTIFGNSVYQLFFNPSPIEALAPKTAATSRGLASISSISARGNIELSCNPQIRQTTVSPKVRIRGPFCDWQEGSTIEKIQVSNKTNQTQAIVFSDPVEKTFLTDYVPLAPGENVIAVEISYKSNDVKKTFQQSLLIQQEPTH